jgi:DNA polymerase-3 subunit beta
MRLSLDQAPLAAALKRVAAFADSRSTIPVFGHVKLEADDTGLSLICNNGTFQIATRLPLLGSESGAVSTEAERLADLVASLRQGLPVQLSHDNGRLRVRSGRTNALLHCAEPEVFPVFLPDKMPAPQIRVTAGELDRVLAFTAPAMGADAGRAALWGLWLGFAEDGVAAATCDGHKGAVCRMRAEMASEFPAATLPRPLCQKLRALLKGGTGEIEIAISPRAARISAADWAITSKLIDAEFPDYRRWMAAPVAKPVTFEKAELLAILARVEAATDLDNQRLKQRGASLSFADQLMRVSDGKQIFDDEMPVAYEGADPAKIGVNTWHLRDLLSAIDADEAELHFKDRDSVIRVCAKDETEAAFTTTPYRV